MTLLEEAKQRYPVGTKFYPAHIKDISVYHTVENTDNFHEEKQDCGGTFHYIAEGYTIGERTYVSVVYYQGKWAEVYDPEVSADCSKTTEWQPNFFF
jgi:hypothetical protein